MIWSSWSAELGAELLWQLEAVKTVCERSKNIKDTMPKVLNVTHRIGRVAVKEMAARIFNDSRHEEMQRRIRELQVQVDELQRELQEEGEDDGVHSYKPPTTTNDEGEPPARNKAGKKKGKEPLS